MEQSDENARAGAPGGEERDAERADRGQMAGEAARGGTADMEDEVRRRAYELYLARGGQPGREFEDWYAAEQEVRARRAAAPASGRSEGSQQREPAAEPPGGMRGMGEPPAAAQPGERAAAPRKRSAPSRRGRPRSEG